MIGGSNGVPVNENNHKLKMEMPWVESPQFLTEIRSSDLPHRIKEIGINLATDGYAVFDPKIENFEKNADGILGDLSKKYDSSGRLTNAWEYCSAVKIFALAPQILTLIKTLYGRTPIPYQTLNFNRGTEQNTHSDVMHFNSVPSRFMCGVWIALEDIHENNGPLHYFKGSHKLPMFMPEDFAFDPSFSIHEKYVAYESFLKQYLATSGLLREEIVVKRGDAVIWASNLLHGGSVIKNKALSRHTQVTHYFFEKCKYYAPIQSAPFSGHVQFLHFKDISTGKKIAQRDLPLLNFNRLVTRSFFKKAMGRLRMRNY
jgi:hypothetical protein